MLIEVERSLKRKCKKIQRSEHRADDELLLLFKKIQEQSQEE